MTGEGSTREGNPFSIEVDVSGDQKGDDLKQVFYDTSEMGMLFRNFNDFLHDDKAGECQVIYQLKNENEYALLLEILYYK